MRPTERLGSSASVLVACWWLAWSGLVGGGRVSAGDSPNVLLILADDLGYSDLGSYGGEIETPRLDALAAGGVRFSQFYNTARCWPTRAAILTGHYAQAVRRDTLQGVPSGARGIRPAWARLLPERLRSRGYRSYHSGKWHVDGTPLGGGFDRSYLLADQGRFFHPRVSFEDDRPLPAVEKGTGYYATRAIADHAIRCLRSHVEKSPDAPFFHFLAFTAPHFPLQALTEDIDRYRERYRQGWEVTRTARWERLESLGLVRGKLSPVERDLGPPYAFPEAIERLGEGEVELPVAWEDLTEQQRSFQATKMAIHAAMVDRMDREIGRVLETLRDLKLFDDTLVLFLSDNGASAEIMVRDDGHDPEAAPGSSDSYLCLGPGWSTVSNTPFRRHKTWTHEGGISTPFIAHWPRGIAARNEIRHSPAHVIDLVPTILELAGGEWKEIEPGLPGASLVPLFERESSRVRSFWWSHEENRAFRTGDLKIVASGRDAPWALHDLGVDRGECRNLAPARPALTLRLAEAWEREREVFRALASSDLEPKSGVADPVPETTPATKARGQLRAGAAVVDISPTTLPAIQNGGFLERMVDRVAEPLHARALALSSGGETVAIVIVDSCMLPLEVCDEVKARVAEKIGLPRERVLIAATHTHTAPGVMDYCLGSRADPAYTQRLPPLVARAVVEAVQRLEPAEIAFASVDAPEHTAVRRWIRRQDRPDLDPFGERTVRAMMHPGYDSADHVGPSGPEDPMLSVVSVRAIDGRPVALLANYAMHYFGVSGGFSPDYFGLFSREIAARLAPGDESFVGMLSQGTSGDIWRRDYTGTPASNDFEIGAYTRQLVEKALEALRGARYSSLVPIAAAEHRETYGRRVPDAERLEWAKRVLPDREKRPENREEVYAEQAFYLHENPREEVVLQAFRIGEIGVAAMPCEVYALTGLEIKARSPLPSTFVIELANGASGYIPPPEQHALGGYNTWPARTAGLEVEAEPRMVERTLRLLEDASARPRRDPRTVVPSAFARAILADGPWAYWQLEEFRGREAFDVTGRGHAGRFEPRVAFRLDGPSQPGLSSGGAPNVCVQLAGGHLRVASEQLRGELTVELWLWNGVIQDDRETRGTILCHGGDELLLVADAGSGDAVLSYGGKRGSTAIRSREWRHLALTSTGMAGGAVRVYLDGRLEIETSHARVGQHADGESPLTFGGGSAVGSTSLEGRLDEIAIYDRVLTPADVARHHAAAD